ncbi:nucleoprotein/polynucleotide-associated enzyme [Lysobacteraceae bacterium NML91-0213]|nr:nucleoprotein/polynucleotide-associated enzyme [Xanthomonadaceae bacterium NML91-0213]
MSDTLRDQLLGLGFKAPTPERKPPRKPATGHQASAKEGGSRAGQRRPEGKPAPGKPPARGDARARGRGRPASREDIDLAKAYAIRAQKEKDERIAAEKQKQEEARLRREARARLATLLDGKALNHADADIARHFEYGGKIKRIYVTAEQLQALNAGELGVAQLNGRYLLVTAQVLAEAEAVFAPSVALRVDPDAPAGDDPYADPRYQVPDDLVW